LDLSNNQILQLSKWGLRKMPALKTIDFSGNRLKTVGGMVFERSRKIEDVSVRVENKKMKC